MVASEVVVSLSCDEAKVPFATGIRSTTLISSLAALEAHGLRDAYFAALSPGHHATMRELVAGQWHSMEVGLAHYGAVESLGIPAAIARANGRRVAEAVQHSHFATIVRALGDCVSFWAVLPRVPAFIARNVQGGECAIFKLGPKDARIELHGIPIACYAYVRSGWAGMFESTLGLLKRKVIVRELAKQRRMTVASFEISWV
ncbi:MAG TPA: hypothetical protein VI299_06980 [Polyangiales bacterium]